LNECDCYHRHLFRAKEILRTTTTVDIYIDSTEIYTEKQYPKKYSFIEKEKEWRKQKTCFYFNKHDSSKEVYHILLTFILVVSDNRST